MTAPRASIAISLALIALTAVTTQAATIYVNDNAPGFPIGNSWINAFKGLEVALAGADAGDEIWVAQGVYMPGTVESETFQLKTGVEVYGGFFAVPGTENSFGMRDPDMFITILSGDIDGNDTNTDGNNIAETTNDIVGANSDHVVTGSGTDGTAVLDGFTITAGQADGVSPDDNGGGMISDNGSPTLSRLNFSGNLASEDGGGIFYSLFGNLTMDRLNFSGNFAKQGAGIYSGGGDSTFTDVTFLGNTASSNGGGMFNSSNDSMLTNVRFLGNSGGGNGGAVVNADSDATLTNVIFSGNSAVRGGAMSNTFSSNLTLTNVTVFGNSATNDGGGQFNASDNTNITIENSIFWGNTDSSGNGALAQSFIGLGTVTVTTASSLVQGSGGSGAGWATVLGADLGGNIDTDPLLGDGDGADNMAGTLDDDLRLRSGSPAINTGDDSLLPPDTPDLDGDNDTLEPIPLDLDGRQRIFNNTVDIGALESQPGTIYVDDSATGLDDGSDWTNAYTDLQAGLSAAFTVGDQIWAAEGLYVPGSVENDTFQLKNGVEIYGGFQGTPGTEGDFSVRDPESFLTILSGDIENNDITSSKAVVTDPANISGDNSDHVVTGGGTDGTAVLDGFTITAGQADGGAFDDNGGGMNNSPGSSTLSNLIFSGNSAVVGGGGIHNFGGSDPLLTNIIFVGNESGGRGGGMDNFDSSDPILINVMFSGNSSNDGGAISNVGSSPTLTNVTLYGNSALNNGGGMANNADSDPTIQNSILWENSAAGSGDQVFNVDVDSTPTITDCLIEGGCPDGQTTCTNVIDADPMFVDVDGPDQETGTADDNLRVGFSSPALDAGNNNADLDGGGPSTDTISDIPTDLGVLPRIIDADGNGTGTVDLGAFETPPAILYVNDDAAGLNNGLNWQDAFNNLQDALVSAVSGIQIWVGGGVYVPGFSNNDTFQLKNQVEIYGGFEGQPGTEGEFGPRDPGSYLTILSGDIDGDDTNTDGNDIAETSADIVGNNVLHVVTSSATDGTAVLDGFTITAGHARGVAPCDRGGGIENDSGSPTLTNLSISGNSADFGGGMCNLAVISPTMTNVTFTGNSASSIGGGMLNGGGSSPTLTNAIFSGNSAANDGGGGMYNSNGALPTLTNVIFTGNTTGNNGGGMYNFNNCSPTLTNVSFSRNTADFDGGGIFNTSNCDPTIQNSLFWGNEAGGAANQIFNIDVDSTPTIMDSLVEGGCPDGQTTCTNVIDTDPLFVDDLGMDGISGTLDDDLRLASNSPAVDAGNNDADLDAGGAGTNTIGDVPTDLDGNPRIVDGDGDMTDTVDFGAYEFQPLGPTPTATESPTLTQTPTRTETGAATATNTLPPAITESPTQTETGVLTATATAPPTFTRTPTITNTGAVTGTITSTSTQTSTGAPSASPTQTHTGVSTSTLSPAPTNTSTQGPSPTRSDTPTQGPSPTITNTIGGSIASCDRNGDRSIDALDLIRLMESPSAGSKAFLFFARCWYEEASP